MHRLRSNVSALLAGLLTALPVCGHEYWILSTPAFPEPGEEVTFSIGSGHRFPESESLLAARHLSVPVVLRAEDGKGRDAKGQTLIKKSGERVWALLWTPTEAGVFRAEVKLGRTRDGAPLTVLRTLEVVGEADDADAYASGEGLEIVPKQRISELAPGGTLNVLVFYDGQPVESQVGLERRGARMQYFSSAPGRAAMLPLPEPGYYLLVTRFRGHTASLTLYVSEKP